MSKEKEIELKVKVKGNIRDLLAFKNLISGRKKKIMNASNEPIYSNPINKLARKLHPVKQHLIIKEIQNETKSTKTYKLIPDPDSETKELAYFRAGQYLSLRIKVNDVSITRPYSISSSPTDALNGFYEITIKKEEHGFLTNYIWDTWDVGTHIECSEPKGFFYYESLRDLELIVGIAGGSGIAPFRSMAREIAEGDLHTTLMLIFGSSEEDDIIFYKEFKELERKCPNKIKIVHVLSCEQVSLDGCEQGFITSDIIEKYCDINNSSFFICGPQVMYNFVEKELRKFDLFPKYTRREGFGEIKDIINYPGFPTEIAEKSFKIEVSIGDITKEIPGKATESILVALERAKLAPPSKCRSGECGFCRSVLISGKIYVNPANDKRRAADEIFNFFHPCSSYPISDLKIEVSRSI